MSTIKDPFDGVALDYQTAKSTVVALTGYTDESFCNEMGDYVLSTMDSMHAEIEKLTTQCSLDQEELINIKAECATLKFAIAKEIKKTGGNCRLESALWTTNNLRTKEGE